MTYSHAKLQGQRSVGSEDRVETSERTDGRTDGRTDEGDCITYSINDVGKYVPGHFKHLNNSSVVRSIHTAQISYTRIYQAIIYRAILLGFR